MEYHRYPIGPILERYGFDPIDTDRGWHAVRCEFHGDRDASGSVNTLDQIYNCFGCGMRGSGTQIIMKMEGLTYRDAVVRAEEITGDRDTSVRSGSRRRNAVPGGSGNYRSYREIRDAWIREDSDPGRSEEHTSELQSRLHLVCPP